MGIGIQVRISEAATGISVRMWSDVVLIFGGILFPVSEAVIWRRRCRNAVQVKLGPGTSEVGAGTDRHRALGCLLPPATR